MMLSKLSENGQAKWKGNYVAKGEGKQERVI